MKLYDALAHWWPLVSPPEDYVEEAAAYRRLLGAGEDASRMSLLELGCGGGSNAFHLKQHFEMTLVDISPAMLEQSRSVNPECRHVQGDMRTLRLERTFDRVFVHDAICYMTSRDDLRAAIETAFLHCRPGGIALFVPDYVRETFQPLTAHGGRDGERRSLRYLEWLYDPDPDDTTYTVDYAFLLRHADGTVQCEYDQHIEGLFSVAEWIGILEEAGFQTHIEPFNHSEVERPIDVFVCVKPG